MKLSSEDEVIVADAVDARPASGVPRTEVASAPARQPLIARFLPSLTDVVFLMPLVVILRTGGPKMMLGDGDTGWHLRAGQWIVANGRVPDHDIFSFTMSGKPWFAWEWLWEVVFGWMQAQWGMAAVLFGSLLVIATTSALLYRLALRTSGNAAIAVAVSLAASFVTSIHWLARPHLLTLLFVVIFLSLLERAETGKTRVLLLLPALMIVWTNVHGGFLAGVILTAAYCGGALLNWAIDTGAEARAEARVRARRYAAVTLACIAATFVNPYGYHLHIHIYRYLSDPFVAQNVIEFGSLNFGHPIGKYIEALLLLGAAVAAWNCYRRRFVFPLLFLAWAHVALVSVRHVPVLAIIAAPAVAQGLAELFAALRKADAARWLRRLAGGIDRVGAEMCEIERIGRIPVLSVVLAAGFFLTLRAQPNELFRAEYDPKRFPDAAVDLLGRPEFRTGVFTQDTWGGFLVYRLYPNFKTFIDGRSDFYGEQFDRKYLDVMNCKHDWQQTLDRYGIHAVVLPVDAPLAGVLRESARWRAVYDDKVAIVFRSVAAIASASVAVQAPAVPDGGISAIARSRISNPVIRTDHHPTRGE